MFKRNRSYQFQICISFSLLKFYDLKRMYNLKSEWFVVRLQPNIFALSLLFDIQFDVYISRILYVQIF